MTEAEKVSVRGNEGEGQGEEDRRAARQTRLYLKKRAKTVKVLADLHTGA